MSQAGAAGTAQRTRSLSPPRGAGAWLAGGLVLGLLVFYLAAQRDEETWLAGDFALYVMHALNIARGHAYAATGFVFDPADAIRSPAAYPPGFPLLLAVPAAICGLSLPAMKVVMSLADAGLLACTAALAQRRLGARWAPCLVLLLGLAPNLIFRRDYIDSDLPFAFWSMLALLAFEAVPASGRRTLWLVLLTLGVAMGCMTRGAGIALFAGLLLASLLAPRPHRIALAAACIAGFAVSELAVALTHADLGTYVGYLDRIRREGIAAYVLGGVRAYAAVPAGLLGLSFGRAGNAACSVILMALALSGFALRLRPRPGGMECFAACMTGLLLLFPVRDEAVRYAVPLLPALLLYIAGALDRVARGARWTPVLALAAGLLIYAPYYATQDDFAGIPDPVQDASSRALYQSIDAHAGDGALVLAREPRIVALFTRARAAALPEHLDASSLRATAEALHATLLVQEIWPGAPRQAALAAALAGDPGLARPLWSGDRFRLYCIAPPLSACAAAAGGPAR